MYWRKKVLPDIMTICIISHKIITEDKYDCNSPIQDSIEAPTQTIEIVVNENL